VPGLPPAVAELGARLKGLGWVSDLLVGGSLATGDYLPWVSDVDLVAVVDGPLDPSRLDVLTSVHRGIDSGVGSGLKLGCVYVVEAELLEPDVLHPTWTHGSLVSRTLSGISRAELVRDGYAVFGRAPAMLLPAMVDAEVRQAARAELTGYWGWAVRRPTLWLNTAFADLSLSSMSRGRHAIATGELITKSQAIEAAGAPRWLIDQVRARRQGQAVSSPRLRTAVTAWRDARRTVHRARNL
jgi:Nucleotidyltransferase domain